MIGTGPRRFDVGYSTSPFEYSIMASSKEEAIEIFLRMTKSFDRKKLVVKEVLDV